jgi:hypothetical protein
VLTVRSYSQIQIMPSAAQPTNGRRQPYEPKDSLYDPYRRTDRYGIMGQAPQPWTEYVRLILLGITLVPIKAVVCFGELLHGHDDLSLLQVPVCHAQRNSKDLLVVLTTGAVMCNMRHLHASVLQGLYSFATSARTSQRWCRLDRAKPSWRSH